jgi:16S rRNA (cytosine1402-N4)-methyltransferase
MTTKHVPVLLNEVIDGLKLQPGMIVADCTIGGGGHAGEILRRISPESRSTHAGWLLGIDQDPAAVARSRMKLQRIADTNSFTLAEASFDRLSKVVFTLPKNMQLFDAILADLGVSSDMLEDPERGFSFAKDGPLDMRMSPRSGLTAADILRDWTPEALANLFTTYGEERFAKRIVNLIVRERETTPIVRTLQLASLVKRAIPRQHKHPATRVFQALRIEVNDELGQLKRFLPQALAHLKPGGRIAIISFHSLEDRMVKQFFKTEATGCICPSEFPVCVCNHQPRVTLITKKPIIPSPLELKQNPRSRSAKLRIAQKL